MLYSFAFCAYEVASGEKKKKEGNKEKVFLVSLKFAALYLELHTFFIFCYILHFNFSEYQFVESTLGYSHSFLGLWIAYAIVMVTDSLKCFVYLFGLVLFFILELLSEAILEWRFLFIIIAYFVDLYLCQVIADFDATLTRYRVNGCRGQSKFSMYLHDLLVIIFYLLSV